MLATYRELLRSLMNPQWVKVIYPLSMLAAGFLIGFILEKLIFVRLRALAKRTPLEWDKIILDASTGLITFLTGIIVFYVISPLELFDEAGQKVTADIFAVFLIVLLTIYLSRLAVSLVAHYTAKSTIMQSTSLIKITVRIVVFSLGLLIALKQIGISITPILTALGVGGLAVALALQDTLSNLFAGLQILMTNKFRKGDFVELDTAQNGYITDITWRNITIRTIHNNLIIVPNNKFAQNIVKNFNFPAGNFNVPITVGVHYESDLEKVEAVTLEVASEVQYELVSESEQYKPFMWYHTFNNSSIDFNVMLQADGYRKRFALAHEFIKRLQRRFAQEQIEIPYPIRNLYFRNDLHFGGDGQPVAPEDAGGSDRSGAR